MIDDRSLSELSAIRPSRNVSTSTSSGDELPPLRFSQVREVQEQICNFLTTNNVFILAIWPLKFEMLPFQDVIRKWAKNRLPLHKVFKGGVQQIFFLAETERIYIVSRKEYAFNFQVFFILPFIEANNRQFMPLVLCKGRSFHHSTWPTFSWFTS